MIKQSFTNGQSEIRFENAESIEDAKANGFAEGSYTRFFINNKPVQNYMALVRSIVEETQKTGKRFVPPTPEALRNLQKEVVTKQNNEIRTGLRNLQAQYKQMGAPEQVLKQLDEAIDKIDISGVRVIQ